MAWNMICHSLDRYRCRASSAQGSCATESAGSSVGCNPAVLGVVLAPNQNLQSIVEFVLGSKGNLKQTCTLGLALSRTQVASYKLLGGSGHNRASPSALHRGSGFLWG